MLIAKRIAKDIIGERKRVSRGMLGRGEEENRRIRRRALEGLRPV